MFLFWPDRPAYNSHNTKEMRKVDVIYPQIFLITVVHNHTDRTNTNSNGQLRLMRRKSTYFGVRFSLSGAADELPAWLGHFSTTDDDVATHLALSLGLSRATGLEASGLVIVPEGVGSAFPLAGRTHWRSETVLALISNFESVVFLSIKTLRAPII
jgi:hypothetical protein